MGDFNHHPNEKVILNLCHQFNLTVQDNYQGGSRGLNKLDFFLYKDINTSSIQKLQKIGTSDHHSILLSFLSEKKLQNRILHTFPRSAISKRFSQLDLQDFDIADGYEKISSILQKEN